MPVIHDTNGVFAEDFLPSVKSCNHSESGSTSDCVGRIIDFTNNRATGRAAEIDDVALDGWNIRSIQNRFSTLPSKRFLCALPKRILSGAVQERYFRSVPV